ncbi:hypothetical protein PIB30_030996, partial [Stylosanthes scabra]|nr:hypothetical protein [Stylosanthes scabra]
RQRRRKGREPLTAAETAARLKTATADFTRTMPPRQHCCDGEDMGSGSPTTKDGWLADSDGGGGSCESERD